MIPRRRYSMEMFERLAEDFARKRLGTAGMLPVRMIEVCTALECVVVVA